MSSHRRAILNNICFTQYKYAQWIMKLPLVKLIKIMQQREIEGLWKVNHTHICSKYVTFPSLI